MRQGIQSGIIRSAHSNAHTLETISFYEIMSSKPLSPFTKQKPDQSEEIVFPCFDLKWHSQEILPEAVYVYENEKLVEVYCKQKNG